MSARRRWEDVGTTGITLALGGAAFAGSFTHIRDTAAGHGQGGWIAYAIAASVDFMAVGSGLEIRRRRRLGDRCRWPVFTLLLSVGMTLAANLATAAPGPWGAAVAVWPAVAFLAVAGLLETRSRRPASGQDRPGETTVPAVMWEDGDRDRPPVPAPIPVRAGEDAAALSRPVPADRSPVPVGRPVPEDRQDRAGRAPSGPDASDLLLVGRAVAADLAGDGRALTRAALIAGVRSRGHGISTGRATELLRRLREPA